jgi:ribonuclease HI
MQHACTGHRLATPCSESKHNGNKWLNFLPTEIYTDGSKIGGKVGAGVAIYMDKTLFKQCKFKLQDFCSNNQAEQIAILKSLELVPTLDGHNPRMVAIYTDSKVTLAAL